MHNYVVWWHMKWAHYASPLPSIPAELEMYSGLITTFSGFGNAGIDFSK